MLSSSTKAPPWYSFANMAICRLWVTPSSKEKATGGYQRSQPSTTLGLAGSGSSLVAAERRMLTFVPPQRAAATARALLRAVLLRPGRVQGTWQVALACK